MYVMFALKRIVLALLDIAAAMGSYYLALMIRFSVQGEINEAALRYFEPHYQFIPFYAVICVLVFAAFKLYSGVWRYAGINDFNRVIVANAVTFVIMVVGTLIFTMRMPLTYYAIGAALQLVFTGAFRFIFRVGVLEIDRAAGKKLKKSHVMIIGSGENILVAMKFLEREVDLSIKPVCIIDTRSNVNGLFMEGVPVYCRILEINELIDKYKVDHVILADSLLPTEARDVIIAACKEYEISVQDFAPTLTDGGSKLYFRTLMEYTTGPVSVEYDGMTRQFANAEAAAVALGGKYVVKQITMVENEMHVELAQSVVTLNDTKEQWVEDYKNETGEEISFF